MRVIERNFLNKEIKTTNLLSIHVAAPFLELLIDAKTTYDVLMKSFPICYQGLVEKKRRELLTFNSRISICPKQFFYQSTSQTLHTRIDRKFYGTI